MLAMTRPRKPNKKPSDKLTITQVGALLESVKTDVERIAEGVSGLASKFDSHEGRLAKLEEEMNVIAPIIKTLAPVPNEIGILKNDIKDIKDGIERIDGRLTAVEAPHS
jgi:hypothetical protein